MLSDSLDRTSFVLLGEVAHRCSPWGKVDSSGVGMLQSRQDAQERRLADPVRSDDSDSHSTRDDERDVVEDYLPADGARHPAGTQGGYLGVTRTGER